MKRWQVHFLGTKKLPEDISAFEVAHFFSFDAETRQAIRAKRNDCQRLGLAVHIGFLRMTGCSLDAFETLPRALLKHLGKHLGIVTPDLSSLRALYRRRRTLFEHQEWAIARLGLKPFSSQRAGALLRRVSEEAEQIITTGELVLFSRSWLYDNSILIPAERRLQDICRRAQQEAEDALLVVIDSLIPAGKRQQWIRALSKPRDQEGISCMEWLQQPPKRRSRRELSEVIEKIDYLKSLGVADFELVGTRLERQQAYASRMRRRRPSRFLKLSEPRRSIELVCWVRVVLMQLMDIALALSGMQTTTVERIARDNRACSTLREKKVTPHVLRHTAAMDLMRSGVDRSVIALWLGHESLNTTQIYLHADIRIKEAALARTSPAGVTSDRYKPPDPLLAFLEGL